MHSLRNEIPLCVARKAFLQWLCLEVIFIGEIEQKYTVIRDKCIDIAELYHINIRQILIQGHFFTLIS